MEEKIINAALILRDKLRTTQKNPLIHWLDGGWNTIYFSPSEEYLSYDIRTREEFTSLLCKVKENVPAILELSDVLTNGTSHWINIRYDKQKNTIIRDLEDFVDKYKQGEYLIEKREDNFFYKGECIGGLNIGTNKYKVFELLLSESKRYPNLTVMYEKIYPIIVTKTKDKKIAVANVYTQLITGLKVGKNKKNTKNVKNCIKRKHGEGLWLDNPRQK